MKHLTISDFKPTLLQFSHDHLNPSESNRLQLIIMDQCSDSIINKYLFKFLTRFLTQESYIELTKERNINKLCAYPLCDLQPSRIKDTYSQSYQKSKLLPYSYLNSYCSKRHFQCSEFYKSQLSEESLFTRKNVTLIPYGQMMYEKITLLEEVLDNYNDDMSLLDVIKKLDNLNLNKVKKTEELSDLLKDIKIIEKDPEPPTMYEYLEDQSKAINGNRLT